MVKNIKISGVILTRNLIDYSACININYNIGSNSTAVTSGSKDTKSLIYYENKNFKIDKRFKKIREVTKEIIKKTNQDDLDIEFAIDDKNRTYILQIKILLYQKQKKT